MTELSPAAQTALDAYHQEAIDYIEDWGTFSHRRGLAAALEAAVDQVVPFAEITPQKDLESRREAMVWGMQHQTQLTRQQLLAIAAELRGDTPTEAP